MSNGERFGAYRLLQRLDAVGPLARYVALSMEAQPSVEPLLGVEGAEGELCVLQCLQADASADLEVGLRYRHLMAQEARLRHDAIVAVREIGEESGQPYMTYELRDGVDLEMLNLRGKVLSAALAATVVGGVLEGLAAAHAQGVYHRGLTPRLVIIDEAGDVSITGFTEGNLLAQFPQPVPDARAYAPELRKGGGDSGPQADVYAVGMLFYRLLTGKVQPDEWEPPWAGLMMDMSAAGVPGESLSRAVDFLQRTLAERPSQRLATMSATQATFRPLLGELGGPKHRALVAQVVQRQFPHIRRTLKGGAGGLSSSDRWAITPISDVIYIPPASAGAPPPPPRTTPAHPDLIEANRLPAHIHSGLTPASGSRQAPDEGGNPPRTRVLGPPSRSSMRAISPELRDTLQRAQHPLEVLARTRYEVIEELGVGGTGTVYKVRDTTLDEILALKLLRADLSLDAAWLQRFKRELRIMRDLAHPNVAPAYHLERVENLCFFTMKFIDGETLYRRLRRQMMTIAQGKRILAGVGAALAAAHRNQIIHRDFKSANIMIERATEHPFLMDFGIASIPDNLGLTATGQGIGTPIYMAPEQALGQQINHQADIFSFGVVLYEIFGGGLPFQPGTTVAVYHAQINAQYKPLREVKPHLPEPLLNLVERCLQPQASLRPASMDEVLEVLRILPD